MTTEDADDADLYIRQLKDVFDSCDTFNNGFLGRKELMALCHKLQLDRQANSLVDKLLTDVGHEEVNFEEFKENFVQILCHSTLERVEVEGQFDDFDDNEDDILDIADDDTITSSTLESGTGEFSVCSDDNIAGLFQQKAELCARNIEEEIFNLNEMDTQNRQSECKEINTIPGIFITEENSHDLVTKEETEVMEKHKVIEEVSPKFVKGDKKYGRRSRPFDPKEFEDFRESVCSISRDRKATNHLKPPVPPTTPRRHSPVTVSVSPTTYSLFTNL